MNRSAFEQTDEARIIEALRTNCDDLLSLVAVEGDRVIGHILFSPATLEAREGSLRGMGLAPMAVLPERQRQGVGQMLIRAGLAELERRECPFIVVLGHPDYYPRFGFEPASTYGIRCVWEVPDEAFMILPLDRAKIPASGGLARYRPEFEGKSDDQG